MKSTHWSKKARKELLKTPIAKLTGLKPLSCLQEAIDEVRLELKNKLPHLPLTFYPSDEWFCVDNTIAIAIPFYLYHPTLRNLEIEIMGKVEEENKDILKRILRHEIGHAVDNAYKLRENTLRQKLFGSSNKKYPKFYSRKVFSQAYTTNLPLNYAQSHPDEDFAETFATWLNPKSTWRKKYRGKACFKKLIFMNELMKEIKHQKPSVKSRRQYDKVNELTGTLGTFYKKRKKIYLSPLEVVINNMNNAKDARLVDKNEIISKLKSEFKMPQYQVKTISKLIGRKDSLPLNKVMQEIPRFLEHQFKRIPL